MLNILVADDNKEIRLRIREVLSELYDHVSITEAATGTEALEYILNHNPDCILMDINMPHKSGIEILKQLSLSPIKTPTIILSTQPSFPYSDYIRELGGIYIEKSCLYEMLPETLNLVGFESTQKEQIL